MIGSERMKKLFGIISLIFAVLLLTACGESEEDIYALLMEAEDLSGMKAKMGTVISEDGDLGLPKEYNGVEITYKSRNPDIISDDGIVTLPGECWIESRDQKGEKKFEGLNDNWPVVIDVTLSYKGMERTAKLLFVVAPREGYTCDKYLG
jgi:major membrane immunogen (membrane-anchored lipoprotein)